MQLVVAEVESRNESRCPLLRAKVKLAGIVPTLVRSRPELLCFRFLGPGSCHPNCSPAQEHTRELQTASPPCCLLLRNLQAGSENTLFFWGALAPGDEGWGLLWTLHGFWVSLCSCTCLSPLQQPLLSVLDFAPVLWCVRACVCMCVMVHLWSQRTTCRSYFSFCHVRILA